MHLSPTLSGGVGCCPFEDCGSVVVESLLIITPVVGALFVVRFIVLYFVTILVYNHLDEIEAACCFAWFVFLVSRDFLVTLPSITSGLSAVCDCGIS